MCLYKFVFALTNFLQRGELKILGNYVAMSIAQGGSGFPVLHPSVYNYIVTGKYIGVRIPDKDIPNPIVNAMLKQVLSSPSCASDERVLMTVLYCAA